MNQTIKIPVTNSICDECLNEWCICRGCRGSQIILCSIGQDHMMLTDSKNCGFPTTDKDLKICKESHDEQEE